MIINEDLIKKDHECEYPSESYQIIYDKIYALL